MDKPKIVNYIEIDGEDVLFTSLSEEQQKMYSKIIQDKIMKAVGYRRESA